MDIIKLEQLITENMKSIFGFSLTRLGNVTEAEDLSSDILYEIIRCAKNVKEEKRFYGFMWKIAENTYVDYLRKKSRNESHTTQLDENFADESNLALDDIIKNEEIHLLRRELSLLSTQYRDVTVLYYIEDLSCSEIANKLQISTEMVKYYLFRARKIIREGMNMERLYGEKSYRPNGFEIDYWGSAKYDTYDYEDFRKRKIKGNILLAAYYSPVTLQELSTELGVALPYLEDEIKLLVDKGYLVYHNGKYLTGIPIFTKECTNAIDKKLKAVTEQTVRELSIGTDNFDIQFGARFANENLARWQKVLLCLHFSLMETEGDAMTIYGKPADSKCGAVWGRSFETSLQDRLPQGIQGIYNGCVSSDKTGRVIAMNFKQTLHAQHFKCQMTDPVVSAAMGRFTGLTEKWQKLLDELGYVKNGKADFTIWTSEEYEELRKMLDTCIAKVTELNRKTSEIAASITSDLAPSHIQKNAEYVGALVYRFRSAENLVNALFETGWLKAVDDEEKPAICVVKS